MVISEINNRLSRVNYLGITGYNHHPGQHSLASLRPPKKQNSGYAPDNDIKYIISPCGIRVYRLADLQCHRPFVGKRRHRSAAYIIRRIYRTKKSCSISISSQPVGVTQWGMVQVGRYVSARSRNSILFSDLSKSKHICYTERMYLASRAQLHSSTVRNAKKTKYAYIILFYSRK